jgi:hypothetical protein
MLQLNPQIPVLALDKQGNWREGQAIGWIDRSEEHHLEWIVAYDDCGEVWITSNPNIRLFNNFTIGRKNVTKKD